MFPQFKEFIFSSFYILATILLLIGGVIFMLFWLTKQKKGRK